MREDILSFSVATRPGLSGSGEFPGGLRANTGTEEKWSRGIRICVVMRFIDLISRNIRG